MASIGVHGGAAGAAEGGGLTDAELRAVAVPVSVAGGATAALQTAGNDDLDTIVSATVSTSNAVTSLAEALGVPGAFLGLATQPVSATDLDIRNLVFATDKIDASGSTGVGVTGTFWQATQPVSMAAVPTGGISLANTFKTRADTYTTTANGVTVDVSAAPLKEFGIQVKGTGASATTWDVRLEGSLNNVDFSAILTHTNVTGDGTVLWLGAVTSPSLYFRSRCAGLALGAATNIVVTILGVV